MIDDVVRRPPRRRRPDLPSAAASSLAQVSSRSGSGRLSTDTSAVLASPKPPMPPLVEIEIIIARHPAATPPIPQTEIPTSFQARRTAVTSRLPTP